MAAQRVYNKNLRGKPVNFLATAPKVNLRSSPAIAPNNIAFTADHKFLITGKIGESTGTILPIEGKTAFWMEVIPSFDLKLLAAGTLHFNFPDRVWLRSDVVHWQRAKGVIPRVIHKGGEVVKEVVNPVVDTVTDVGFSILWKAAPLLIAAGLAWKFIVSPQTAKR